MVAVAPCKSGVQLKLTTNNFSLLSYNLGRIMADIFNLNHPHDTSNLPSVNEINLLSQNLNCNLIYHSIKPSLIVGSTDLSQIFKCSGSLIILVPLIVAIVWRWKIRKRERDK